MEAVKKKPLQETRSHDLSTVVADVADQYLQLGSQGVETEFGSTSLWRQMTVQPLQISAYLACLIGRLVSLDSGYCQQPLPVIVSELFSLDPSRQDRDGFIRWYTEWIKQAPSTPAALNQRCNAFQYVLLNTLHFVSLQYFVRVPKVPRGVYLRWEWARKLEHQNEAEQYVFKMVSRDSHWTNTQGKDQAQFIRYLVDHCRKDFFRGSLTSCISTLPSLKDHVKVMHSIHYANLCQLLASGNDPSDDDDDGEERARQRPTACAETALLYVIDLLEKLQISKSAKEEQLLPLLSLFTNLATMTPTLSSSALNRAYKAINQFYLWPQPYCEVAKDVLDFIFTEQRCPGIHFRRLLLTEHQVELPHRDEITKINSEHVHIIVDKSAPRGVYFGAAFERQETDSCVLKRKLLMHLFYSTTGFTSLQELTELEADLENCHEPDLSQLCCHGLRACEEAALLTSRDDSRRKLTARLQDLRELLSKFRGRQSRSSVHSRSPTEIGATVEEVYSVQAKPMLWLPQHRPHELRFFDGEVSDASGAESALQSILTEHQGRRHKEPAPTAADIKYLTGVATKSQRSTAESLHVAGGTASLPPGLGLSNRSSGIGAGDDIHSHLSGDQGGYEVQYGSSVSSDQSSRLFGGDAMIAEVLSTSSADSTPHATPQHVESPENARDKSSKSSSGDVSVLSPIGSGLMHVNGDDDGMGSESTILKPGSLPPDITLNAADSLEKQNRSPLPGSSVMSSDSSLRSPPVEVTPTGRSSLKPGPGAIAVSRSMEFPPSRADEPPTKFSFESEDAPQRKVQNARSSASLDKPESFTTPPVQKRSSYSQILKRRGSHKVTLSTKDPVVKVVIAGDDRTVRLFSQAYVHLRRKFKFLFEGVDVKFYYVPLSRASGGGGLVDTVPIQVGGAPQLPRRFHVYNGALTSSVQASPAADLMTSLFDSDGSAGSVELPYNGGDAWFGRFLSHLDGWYERNLMLAIHGSLRVVPQEALDSDTVPDSMEDNGMENYGPTPRTVISDAVFSYCRLAQYEVKCRLYQIELTDSGGNNETYVFLQRVEMIVPAKAKKPPELKIEVHKVGLDEAQQGVAKLATSRYWGMRLSNLPHPQDVCPTNVESLGLEMTLTDSSANRGGSRGGSGVIRKSVRGSVQPEVQSFHVGRVDVVSTSLKEVFCVSIDSDVCCQNIVSFQVKACSDMVSTPSSGVSGGGASSLHPRTMTMSGLGARPTMSATTMMGSPGSRRQSHSSIKGDEQGSDISLPVMMFWPPEL